MSFCALGCIEDSSSGFSLQLRSVLLRQKISNFKFHEPGHGAVVVSRPLCCPHQNSNASNALASNLVALPCHT